MKRSYRLGRRADAADETRRRIVEATFALHTEQGIAATTMKQIAARADVSVGTVYHHFPTYEDTIEACGRYTAKRIPPPDRTIFDGLDSAPERIGRLALAMFGYYHRNPGFARVRCDQDRFPPIARFMEAAESHRMQLVAEALGQPAEDRTVATVTAVLDVAVYHALARAGLGLEDAAGQIAAMINGALEKPRR